MIGIRKAEPADHNTIWEILKNIINRGDVFAYAVTTSKEEMIDIFISLL